ncbi:probable DNA metabolism protein [Parafannyhessea umbonata]|uniref:Probable DNA metabolism protein n=1 Tax=Parafannyhessea umbonata TaxID=604330 RepID=A0A1H9NGE9_9ACTN|nr:probable DNA metabolism protein [Parafannyhessea umbonata]
MRQATTGVGGRPRGNSRSSSTLSQREALAHRSEHADEVAPEVQEIVERVRNAISGCDGLLVSTPATLEGVLAAVGVGYLAHVPHERMRLCVTSSAQPMLGEAFETIPEVLPEGLAALARRVYAGLQTRLAATCPRAQEGRCPARCSGECAFKLAWACASDSKGMPESVHRYVVRCFAEGAGAAQDATDPVTAEVDALARQVMGECEHARQFVRFSHMADDTLGASFSPNADVLPFVSRHFARRMREERFYVVDPVHATAIFHDRGWKACEVARLDARTVTGLAGRGDLAPDERYVRALWKRFYDGLELKGRNASQRGYDLRKGWMPVRFWRGLFELDPRSDDPGPHVPERYRGGHRNRPA